MLLKFFDGIEESVTYQAILKEDEARGVAKGRLDEAQDMLVLLGTYNSGRRAPLR